MVNFRKGGANVIKVNKTLIENKEFSFFGIKSTKTPLKAFQHKNSTLRIFRSEYKVKTKC